MKKLLNLVLIVSLITGVCWVCGCKNAGRNAYKAGKGARESGSCLWKGISGKDSKGCR